MTTVNVTTTQNTVTVTANGSSTVVQTPATTTVTATTVGPQGPKGLDLDDVAKVNGSVVYYDSAAGKFKADTTWTTSTLVTGGDF